MEQDPSTGHNDARTKVSILCISHRNGVARLIQEGIMGGLIAFIVMWVALSDGFGRGGLGRYFFCNLLRIGFVGESCHRHLKKIGIPEIHAARSEESRVGTRS